MAVITKRKNVSKSKSKSNSKTRKQFKSIRKNGMRTRKMMRGGRNLKNQGSQGKKSALQRFTTWLKPGMSKVAPSTPPSTPPLGAQKVPNLYNSESSVMSKEEQEANTQTQMKRAFKTEKPVIQYNEIERGIKLKANARPIKEIKNPQILTGIENAFKKQTTLEQIKKNTLQQQNADHISGVLREMKLLNGTKFSNSITKYGINPKNNKPLAKQISNLYKKQNKTKTEQNLIDSIYPSQV